MSIVRTIHLWLVGRIHDVDIYVNGMKPFFPFQIPQDVMKEIY